jgi:flagellar export protein FliJ
VKRFSFRLEQVLDWRRQQAEIEETKLERLFCELRKAEADQQQAERDRAEAADSVLTGASVTAQDLAALDSYRQHLDRVKRRLEQQHADCLKRIAEQQKHVRESQRQVKLLENLKDRRLHDWEYALQREVDNLAAELHLTRRASSNP